MSRIKIIITNTITCVAFALIAFLLQSCSTSKSVNAFEENGNLLVDKSEFINEQEKSEYESIIVTSNYVRKPIILFKTGTDSYEAYSLECTHDGVTLDLVGTKLKCSADGSEFDKSGKVTKAPAKKDLRQYSVDKTISTIKIATK